MITLCSDPNCNLIANHDGEHSFVYICAWEKLCKEDRKKIQKAGCCTPRGGAKGGYQNHVNRNSKVIIPYEMLCKHKVNLDNYKDGYVIRLFPSQYFSSKHTVSKDFQKNNSVIVGGKVIKIIVGKNAFVLYRTYEDYETLPPLKGWKLRSILKFDEALQKYCIPTEDRRGKIKDRGHYLLRISNSGTDKVQKPFDGPPINGPAQGIFAPEYADSDTNFLCQAVLAWLIIKTKGSPYKESDFEHLQAILKKHGLLNSPHYEKDFILHNGKTTCPLCQRIVKYRELNEPISFEDEEGLENSAEQVGSTRSTKINLFHMVPLRYKSLEHKPTQVSWGHATCNTKLGQRKCYSYSKLQKGIKVEIIESQNRELLGYASKNKKFIRSEKGEVWIRISKGEKQPH